MGNLGDLAGGLVPGSQDLSVAFVVLLLVHVPAGLTCVVAGAVAAASRKRRGRHPAFGTVYYWGLAAVFVSASGMAFLRWTEDRHLFALGTISFAVASVGYLARRLRWPGWTSFHILGMGISYVVLLTAFYVDNGPHLPILDHLPAIAYWTLPSVVGAALLRRGIRGHTHLVRDLRSTRGALLARLSSRSRSASPSEPERTPRTGG